MRCASPVGLLLVSALVLAACGSPQKLTNYQEVATPITLTPKQIASIRAGVAKGFADRDLRAVKSRTHACRTDFDQRGRLWLYQRQEQFGRDRGRHAFSRPLHGIGQRFRIHRDRTGRQRHRECGDVRGLPALGPGHQPWLSISSRSRWGTSGPMVAATCSSTACQGDVITAARSMRTGCPTKPRYAPCAAGWSARSCGLIGADVRPDWSPHVNKRRV